LAAVGEAQHEMMIELVDQGRVVDLHDVVVAMKIGERHEQVERVPGRQQRSPRMPRLAHGGDGVVHQPCHDAARQRWPEPARAHQQRQLLPNLEVADRAQHAGGRGAP
jgi:hypothetical protein